MILFFYFKKKVQPVDGLKLIFKILNKYRFVEGFVSHNMDYGPISTKEVSK